MTKAISWLTIIAREKEFFRDAGLDIDFRTEVTGRMALSHLQKGWVDVANLIDANIAYLGFERKQNVKCVACTQIKEDETLLVRKDRNIRKPVDLYGKKIAYLPKTSSHMFLVRFFEHHGLDIRKSDLVAITPDVMQRLFLKGDVDALSAWEPHITQTRLLAAQEDIDVTGFDCKGIYKFYVVLAVSEKLLSKQRESVLTILDVLKIAAQFAQDHSEDAQKILAEYTDIPFKMFRDLWPKYSLTIEPIGQNFLEQVRMQAQWIKPGTDIDYAKYIDNLC